MNTVCKNDSERISYLLKALKNNTPEIDNPPKLEITRISALVLDGEM
jgi:hypothetical protein